MTAVSVGIWLVGTVALVVTGLLSLWRNRRDQAVLTGRMPISSLPPRARD